MVNTAVMPSETYARKAQRLLTAKGYTCELIRLTNPREGCYFGLNIIGNPEEVQEVLRQAGIPVRYFGNERDLL